MQLGLFIRRELITWARRGTVFPDRVAAVIVVAAVVAGCVLVLGSIGLGTDHDCRGGPVWPVDVRTGRRSSRRCLRWLVRRSVVNRLGARPQKPRLAAGDPAHQRRDRAGNDGGGSRPIGELAGGHTAGCCPGRDRRRCPAAAGVADRPWGLARRCSRPRRSPPSSRFTHPAVPKPPPWAIGLVVCWLDIPIISEFLQPRAWPGIPRWLLYCAPRCGRQ